MLFLRPFELRLASDNSGKSFLFSIGTSVSRRGLLSTERLARRSRGT